MDTSKDTSKDIHGYRRFVCRTQGSYCMQVLDLWLPVTEEDTFGTEVQLASASVTFGEWLRNDRTVPATSMTVSLVDEFIFEDAIPSPSSATYRPRLGEVREVAAYIE